MTDKDVLLEKDLLEKTATMKRFEYLLLDKELKAQMGIAKKQYQGLNKFFKSDKKEEPVLKNYSKSYLIYGANHSFDKY